MDSERNEESNDTEDDQWYRDEDVRSFCLRHEGEGGRTIRTESARLPI